MEFPGYTLLHFHQGYLPWQGLNTTDQEHKGDLILGKKETLVVRKMGSTTSLE